MSTIKAAARRRERHADANAYTAGMLQKHEAAPVLRKMYDPLADLVARPGECQGGILQCEPCRRQGKVLGAAWVAASDLELPELRDAMYRHVELVELLHPYDRIMEVYGL